MEQFRFAKFLLTFLVKTPIILDKDRGVTFRGGFGLALLKIFCLLKREKCLDLCPIEGDCPYYQIFKTPVSLGGRSLAKGNYAPHPFIILPPLDDQLYYNPDERLRITLTLIGQGISYLPLFIEAFQQLGELGLGKERGKFSLEKVEALNVKGEKRDIYDTTTGLLDGTFPQISFPDLFCEDSGPNLTIHFRTPTRIIKDGKFQEMSKFPIFFEALIRRLTHLLNIHCRGSEASLNYKRLREKGKTIQTIESHLQWIKKEHYSTWQRKWNSLSGFVGKVTYEGNFKELISYILAGEYVHIGKGTAYGCGNYIVEK